MNRDLADRVERQALHGLSLGAWQRFSDAGFRHYEVVEPGFKFNMTDIQASFGLRQLPRLDGWIERRAQLWKLYDEEFADLPLELPSRRIELEGLRHARHLYTVNVSDHSAVSRDQLLGLLTQRQIGTGVHYRAVHLHPYYRDCYGLKAEAFPRARHRSDRTLSLPLSPKVSEADVQYVAEHLRAIL